MHKHAHWLRQYRIKARGAFRGRNYVVVAPSPCLNASVDHDANVRVYGVVGGGGGRATAARFTQSGAHVLIAGRRPEPLAETRRLHPEIATVTADIRVKAEVDRVVAEALRLWGRIDVLVNNAGAFARSPLETASPDLVLDLFATNVLGPTLMTQAALPHLKASRGSVVNVSSTYGHKASPGASLYAASKAAIEHLTRCWALELAPHKIRVNAVAPGPTETPILQRSGLPMDVVEAIKNREAGLVPLGRRGAPDEVAAWIVTLTDPSAEWITGQILSVDGGLSL